MEDIAVVAMFPTMSNPMRAEMGWTIPATGDPNVATAIPAVVSADPDVAGARCDSTALDDGSGRSYVDHDLRKRGGRRQSDCEQQS
jgi:hypothetical protein